MEKMIWEKPQMNEVAFAANEYVAACGDTNISSYMFACDAPRGDVYYYTDGRVQAGAVRPESFSEYSVDKLGGYEPCGKTHNTGDSTDFYWGFVDWNNDGEHTVEGNDETAIVWVEFGLSLIWGRYERNWHATTNLDMNTWETAKS